MKENYYFQAYQTEISICKLDLLVENLQMTEESVEDKLPVVFDRYSIKGQNFFFDRMMCMPLRSVPSIQQMGRCLLIILS
jgi:hypothetical protein